MTFPQDPSTRQPKGDHNRRLALGMDIEVFAAEAGLSQEQVHEYEMTSPDHDFDEDVAQRYGAALERMEANPPSTQIVQNSTVIQPNSASASLPESPDPQAPAFKDGELPGAVDQPRRSVRPVLKGCVTGHGDGTKPTRHRTNLFPPAIHRPTTNSTKLVVTSFRLSSPLLAVFLGHLETAAAAGQLCPLQQGDQNGLFRFKAR